MKSLSTALFLALGICLSPIPSSFAEGGLAERRAIKAFQETKFAQVEKDIDAAAGFDVKVNVDWDKLARPGEAESYSDDKYFMDTIFLPIVDSLKDVTRDEMGKGALKEKLKEVSVTYDEATAPASNYANGVTFENGVLAVNFAPYTNSDSRGEPNFKDRVSAIVKTLEAKL